MKNIRRKRLHRKAETVENIVWFQQKVQGLEKGLVKLNQDMLKTQCVSEENENMRRKMMT